MENVLRKIMPARSSVTPPRVVADFDKLIDEPIGFKFKGKTYTIKPVDTRTFIQMAEILGRIQTLVSEQAQGRKVTEAEIYNAYHDYIYPLCPEFTVGMLRSMTLPQVHGLVNLIIKHVTGQPMNMDEEEKKKMRPAI